MSAASKPSLRGLRARRLTVADIGMLNVLFTDAFSDRYRRDGLTGVRVPPLNPLIWRYALDDAGDGAMCWVDVDDRLVAFNIAHVSGAEGWMGPLAVRPEWQGTGLGTRVVSWGIDHLRARGCAVIGLETMPRTMDNIGFYSRLGFLPSHLTITFGFDAAPASYVALSQIDVRTRLDTTHACAALVERLQPGIDFTRELQLSSSLKIGDTVVLAGADGSVEGFALCHDAPLVEGRPREDTRVLKLAVAEQRHLAPLLAAVGGYARDRGTVRATVRVQGDYPEAHRVLVAMGARIRWTDLRMTLSGAEERIPPRGLVFSNWEI